ncbi:hypothetical protein WMF27_07440 [Sorangium sp. So ce281]|uniref:polysaccharide deacetylase family protein n=1 Tax=unclassified Sorangium TaxID=2621164 RepID=UPI003F5D8B43
MADGRTRVYITVDVECAEERILGDTKSPAMGYDLRIWGRFVNQREPLGIELIMRELEAYGQRGTFFVEAIGSYSFGMDGLTSVCQALHSRGHDVQLHVHPVQRRADWHTRGEPRVSDDIADYPVEEQTRLLLEGRDLLVRAGVPASELLGYRAGNFGASNDTWRAMKRAGLVLSSNYNPCYFSKNCKMQYPGARLGLFETPEPGVYELPVTNFIEPTKRFRHLQITAVTLDEIKHCLLRYRALGVKEVTLVTHSFEFYFLDSAEARRGFPNRLNVERLRGLCRFLDENSKDFEVDTVGALARRLSDAAPSAHGGVDEGAPPSLQFPHSSAIHHARRVVEQAYKRVAQRFTFG